MAELVVRLTVQTGPHRGEHYCFRGPGTCLVGRAEDCFMRLAGTHRDLCISRHHCQLHIDPPLVLLEDLNSANGTYVNGRPVKDAHVDCTPAQLKNGDLITIAGTTFAVDLVQCPPDLPEVQELQPIWQVGEQSKKNCPVGCWDVNLIPLDVAAHPCAELEQA